MDMEQLNKFLKTPRDISHESLPEQAEILALHFIGYVAKPIGISENLYKKCIKVFDNNRGKIENEILAILKILEENNVK